MDKHQLPQFIRLNAWKHNTDGIEAKLVNTIALELQDSPYDDEFVAYYVETEQSQHDRGALGQNDLTFDFVEVFVPYGEQEKQEERFL
jgi:hypothetical protein